MAASWPTPHGAYFAVETGYWVFDRDRDRWTLWRSFDGRFYTGKVKTTRGHSARYDHLHEQWQTRLEQTQLDESPASTEGQISTASPQKGDQA